MNLRNTIKTVALAGLTTMALPMTAQAALTFGAWSVGPGTGTTGVITSTSCTKTGYSACSSLVNGEGFLQEQVTIDGITYIHTVITDPNASGDPNVSGQIAYSDESFVLSNGTSAGIAAKQSTDDASFNFKGSTTLYTGWAAAVKPAGDANLNIAQSFSDAGGAAQGDEFNSSFGLKINLDGSGNQTGKSMSIGQTVEMGNGTVVNTTDIQQFVIEQRTGTMLPTASSQVNTAPTANGLMLGNTQFSSGGTPINGTNNNGTDTTLPDPVNWLAGDDVMVVWLGQKVSDGSGAGTGLSVFGYESVAVVAADRTGTPNDQFASTFSTNTDAINPLVNNVDIGTANQTTPFNWDAAATWDIDPVATGTNAPVLPAP